MFAFMETIAFLTTSFLLVHGTQNVRKLHTIVGPFKGDNAQLAYWDLTGTSELEHDFICLTSDEPGQKGAIWNNVENELRDWELQANFRIHGKGANLVGDGMAIWYARESLHLGPVFGSKDYFSGLGVFIDTYKNQEDDEEHLYPYISVMVNNGTLHYSSVQDGRYTTIGGCHAKVRNQDFPVKIAVSYIRSALMIFLDVDGLGNWKQCFKSHGIHLPTGYYFGVSASTGELSDNHDVYSVKVLDMEPADSEKEDRSGIIPEAEYFKLPKERKGIVEVRIDASDEEYLSLPTILGIVLCAAMFNLTFIAMIIFGKRYFHQRKQKCKMEHIVHIILYPDTDNVF